MQAGVRVSTMVRGTLCVTVTVKENRQTTQEDPPTHTFYCQSEQEHHLWRWNSWLNCYIGLNYRYKCNKVVIKVVTILTQDHIIHSGFPNQSKQPLPWRTPWHYAAPHVLSLCHPGLPECCSDLNVEGCPPTADTYPGSAKMEDNRDRQR